jgi:hypothetical protein
MLRTRFGIANSDAIFPEHKPKRIGAFTGA